MNKDTFLRWIFFDLNVINPSRLTHNSSFMCNVGPSQHVDRGHEVQTKRELLTCKCSKTAAAITNTAMKYWGDLCWQWLRYCATVHKWGVFCLKSQSQSCGVIFRRGWNQWEAVWEDVESVAGGLEWMKIIFQAWSRWCRSKISFTFPQLKGITEMDIAANTTNQMRINFTVHIMPLFKCTETHLSMSHDYVCVTLLICECFCIICVNVVMRAKLFWAWRVWVGGTQSKLDQYQTAIIKSVCNT